MIYKTYTYEWSDEPGHLVRANVAIDLNQVEVIGQIRESNPKNDNLQYRFTVYLKGGCTITIRSDIDQKDWAYKEIHLMHKAMIEVWTRGNKVETFKMPPTPDDLEIGETRLVNPLTGEVVDES